MAADEARAQRIRSLKAAHPELTWRKIADHVGVTERAAVDWAKVGGMEWENAKKLALLFPEVTLDYIWSGKETTDPTPDLMETMDNDRLTKLEKQVQKMGRQMDALTKGMTQILTAAEARGLLEPPSEEPPDTKQSRPGA